MDKNLLKNTAQRLNIFDESVLKKTEEYLRLYQNIASVSKASVKTLSEQAKITFCLDLASQTLGCGFDKETALILSGLKKSAYQNNLNNLKIALGLNKEITISDICVQLGCTDIKEDAENILNKYQQFDSKVKDLEHPQYVAAATYVACKAKKISVDKPKLVSFSRLKQSQFKELVSAFEKLGLSKPKSNISKKITSEEEDNMIEMTDNQESNKKDEVEEVEDYEVWKKRILEEAYEALK